MPDLIWVDPPPTRLDGHAHDRFVALWQPVVDELRANPGRWACIATGLRITQATTLGGQIRRHKAPFTAVLGDFEVTQRTTAPGAANVYARWLPEVPEPGSDGPWRTRNIT